jgi:hypothetical protein
MLPPVANSQLALRNLAIGARCDKFAGVFDHTVSVIVYLRASTSRFGLLRASLDFQLLHRHERHAKRSHVWGQNYWIAATAVNKDNQQAANMSKYDMDIFPELRYSGRASY